MVNLVGLCLIWVVNENLIDCWMMFFWNCIKFDCDKDMGDFF